MKKYVFPDSYEKKSEDYEVYVNGESIEVYSCDTSAYPLNRVWPGKQRSTEQTEKSSFIILGSDDEVTVSIQTVKKFEKVSVRPSSKNIIPVINNETVSVTLPGAGQYSIEFDNMHNSLVVFVNPEKDFNVDLNCDDVLYFPPGVHTVEKRIELSDNQTVFIDEGAVVYASINATDKKNIRVLGYGILDNSKMERANEINGCAILDKNAGENTGNPIFFNRCENIVVDGICIVNSSGWNMYIDGCKNILIDNIKLIGQWRYNADGCDFCNCTNGILKNSFLRTFDDCVTVKGFKLNNNLPAQNILVDNCVLWCDWGRALEIGAETSAPYISDITFRNCDIIHGSAVMLDIQHGDKANIANVKFEDIRIEYTGEEQKLLIQENDDDVYSAYNEKHVPVPIVVQSGVTMWSIDDKAGNVEDVHFKNIKIYTNDNSIPQGSMIGSREQQSKINNIYFEDIYVNDTKIGVDALGLVVDSNVGNVHEK